MPHYAPVRQVLCPRTVEKHVERLMAKTNPASRADLASLARDLL
jgi:DNA-binding NarL/FixJ family response regulator